MDIRAIAIGVGFALMWSSAFAATRIIVVDAPPLTTLALRFLLSGAVGVAVALAIGQNWRLSPQQWRATLIFALCQNALYLGMNFVAMQWVEASLAAIIASTMPLLVAAAAWALLREPLRPAGIAGLVAGFGGVVIIMWGRLEGGADTAGVVLCVLAALALAFATLTVRNASTGGNILMIVGLQMLAGAAFLAFPAAFFEPRDVNWSWQLVAAFLYVTFVPGLLATWVWFRLVGRIGATRAATFHFLNPFFAVVIAAALLGESVGRLDVLGVAVVMAGILAVQLSRQPKTPRLRPQL